MPARLPLDEAPRAIRLHRASGVTGAPPRVPFGLSSWTDDAQATAIALELPPLTGCKSAAAKPQTSGHVILDLAQQIARALPAPETLPAGALLVVLGDGSSSGGLVARVLQSIRRTESVPRAARATALLARGYTHIGAARDQASGHDLVWGFSGLN
ncbi:MAG TPA: hypothetical protein VNO21_02915 [Polyangiaceae bacterium]|nr:hypothetical protein [Polyangiaceae bacterium]